MTNGVPIWRPLLPHTKDDVYDFAHTYGVPYFKDTTPLWSTRGKTRNSLVPLLQDMYGDGCLEKLSEMGAASRQLRSLVERSLQPFWDGVLYTPTCAVVPVKAFAEEPVFFWREAMKAVCHTMGTGKIGEKPLKILRDRLLNPKGKEGWVALKRDNKAFLFEGTLTLFRGG